MNIDDFEQKLQRQPMRQVPAGWRDEILAAATARRPPQVTRHSFLSTSNPQLSTLLWPHPKAWAGLAAVWVLILAVDFSLRDPSSRIAETFAPPSPEVMVELKKQQLLFAELVGSRGPLDADRQKIFPPKPRSERVAILTA
ncbi:MAG: hypothetical protein WAO02_06785 [Verrucomicrobiia bacterium]